MVEKASTLHTAEQRKIHAVAAARRWGSLLASQCPTLALDYRARGQVWRYSDLARIYLPQLSTTHPNVAREAVRIALRSKIDPDELKELVAYYREKIEEDKSDTYGSEEFKDKVRRASQKRYTIHPAPVEALMRGRGQTPWSSEEDNDLREMLKNPAFYYNSGGARKGMLNTTKMAQALEDKYHTGRTPAAVGKHIHKRLQYNRNGNI